MPKIYEMNGVKEQTFKPDGSRWPDLFGVELELENVANITNIPYWSLKEDNSLRNGVEYVLDRPYGGQSLVEALDSYYGANFDATNSVRTSTHVHVNALDMELDALRALIVLVYTLEDAIFNVVGADRKWAGYAMPLSEMNTNRLRGVLVGEWPQDGLKILGNLAPAKNQERYYGLNFAATRKYGSVEFRYFPGGPARDELESWLDLIRDIKKAAVKFGSPQALIDRIYSATDIVGVLDENFTAPWVKKLLDSVPPQLMLDRFNEVATLCTDVTMERREPMVFITSSLLKFIGTKMLTGAGLTYLEKLRPLGVLTADEWEFHYDKASRLEKGGDAMDDELVSLKKIKFPAPGNFQEINNAERVDEVMREAPPPQAMPARAVRNFEAEILVVRDQIARIERDIRNYRERGEYTAEIQQLVMNQLRAKHRRMDQIRADQRAAAADQHVNLFRPV